MAQKLAFGVVIAAAIAFVPSAWAQAPLTIDAGRDAEGRVLVTPALCRALKNTVPSADYQPGIDANGRPVAPADLPGTALSGDGVQADVRLFVDPRSGQMQRSRAGVMPDIEVGRLLIDTRGGGAWNNQPVPGLDRAALVRACAALPPG